ncbi:MAG: CsgG/HfaB family protein [Flavobacteriales bacterium]
MTPIRITWFIGLTLSIVLGYGCSGSKAYVKRGIKMEEVGMMEQAAGFFYTAVMKNRANPDALAGMQRAGQWVLNDHLRTFDEARLAKNRGRAVTAYETAEAYHAKIEQLGIRLIFPETSRIAFNQVKNAHLDDLYTLGMQALEKEDFAGAQTNFDEIIRLQPDYLDAAQLANVAFCEPLYREATLGLEAERWRTALNALERIEQRDAGYKDVLELKNTALEKGRYPIALVAFENGSNRSGMETKLRSFVQQAISDSQDPFLILVDRENQALILKEQKLALSGVLDGNSAVEVGSMLGAKAILKGTVISCDVRTSSLQKRDITGFESYLVPKVNEDGKKVNETKYRTVVYQEYSRSRAVDVTVQIQLISLETGKTEVTELLTRSSRDDIEYVRYSGNAKNLFPASSNGNVNRSGRNALIQKMNGRTELNSETSMVDALVEDCAHAIQGVVETELKRLVP